MKTVYLIHGWGGNPENCWFPWLKRELEKRGHKVHALAMPHPDEPTIKGWISMLDENINPDENTFLVGHSIGCQAIMRYLMQLPSHKKVGGCVFVGGFVHLHMAAIREEGEEEAAKPWLETPLDWSKIKRHATKFTALFSDNDYFVPVSDAQVFEEQLGAKVIVDHEWGHYDDEAGIKELPQALGALEEMFSQ